MNFKSCKVYHPLINVIKNKKLFTQVFESFGSPTYVYSKRQLIRNISAINNALKANFKKYQICYTIKANSNPHIIKVLKSEIPHLGADCSSPGEIYAADLGGIHPNNCIFTGNYESIEDLEYAYKKNVHINLDDINSFHRLKKIGIPTEISFRLNPGFGKGAFSQVVTGGKNSKFGVPKHKIIDAYKLAKENGVKEFGIQCMTGSGVLDPNYFPKLMEEIIKNIDAIMKSVDIKFNHVSMGGGFGIPYDDHQTPLNFDKVFKSVSDTFHSFFKNKDIPELWIEPGKSVVGNTGVLLASVTGIKKSYKNFVGLDAGMETLMRPALYNAYHRLYKIGDLEAPNSEIVDFTGRICENTDRLAVERPFPSIQEGDLIAVMDAGAYGFSMSHQFCTRPKAAEILIDGEKLQLIRKRETIEDIFSKCQIH